MPYKWYFLVLSLVWITGIVFFAYDLRRYPICPECRDNANTRRIKLFHEEACCKTHGSIRTKVRC